ncbi:hypothetical protein BGZ76_011665 [Entomortierella beljakovae]|nr:hypothetical protein BGZ76_011665 [Entomortierella beljakovae]
MSTTSEPQEGYGGNPPSSNNRDVPVNKIVPGSVFDDDIPLSTFPDGAGFDPPSIPPPSSSSSPPSSSGKGGIIGQIEVNSTIQTVLISLGICVGALFLLGVIATQYISHKNKRAAEKKIALKEKGILDVDDDDYEGGLGEGEKGKKSGLKKSLGDIIRNDLDMVLIDEKGHRDGMGHYLLGPTQPPKSKARGFSIGSNNSPPVSTQSPKGSIIGGIGRAVGGGGHAGTGSFQMGVSGPRGPGSNPRNSFMDTNQVYNRRPSLTPTPVPPTSMPQQAHMSLRNPTPGYSQVEHPRQGGTPPDLRLNHNPFGHDTLGYPCNQDLISPMFAISPSSIATDDTPDTNPFSSPPLSAGSKSSLLLDPFRTQNNSQLSLNLIMSNEDKDQSNGGAADDDDDIYPFPTSVETASVAPLSSGPGDRSSLMGRPKGMSTSISSPTISSSQMHFTTPRSLDDLSEPKLVLRQLQSGVPSYHRHTLMSTPSGGAGVPNIFENGYCGSPATRTLERQAGYSSVSHDRRSIAGSVVTPTSGSHSSSGSINEGNAWYRKRASVVIPEGSAHVKLWKDGESFSPSSPGVTNRASRSSSQSSSQSHGSHSPSVTFPSPLRMNRQRKESNDTNEQQLQQQQQQSIQLAQRRLDLAKENLSNHPVLGLPPPVAPRNGAAVFEGETIRSKSPVPTSTTPLDLPVIMTDGQLMSEPEQLGSSNIGISSNSVGKRLGDNILHNNNINNSNNNSSSSNESEEQQQEEEVDQVIVRLRTPRRGSHSGSIRSNRQSYLDDYREQQQQQQKQL